MDTLNNLNTLIEQLQVHAATIGITLAGLMVGIYAMMIMFTNDNSPTTRSQRWEQLQKVLICAGIIAATGTLIQFAQSLAHML
ncbi:hypothetical protein EI42_04413 [Thermosporothrix hazakensis]|jgi:EamA domain-containing membrane protein RarD|uniref:Uncharacterized protein n=2 Tax=Thermosporothrix TaxID=768650 RepID=A0A326UBC4_THEHA|nr:hypothetical protein [Thermosporothrix hazakensis]PZW25361.1 hypothetical protein EI42_04413 [Thermosporothrix hazakensis]BBH87204.1 hypothetical protein KTC_19550 [Thermosporothrix sp. COM3]GCE50593.1 hypothetical protein KTH_54620 [Thermosporothrix hazakensis]